MLEAIASGPQTLPGLARLVGSPEPVVEGMLSTLLAGGLLEEIGVAHAKSACPNCAMKSLCVTPTGACSDPPRLRVTERGSSYLGRLAVAA